MVACQKSVHMLVQIEQGKLFGITLDRAKHNYVWCIICADNINFSIDACPVFAMYQESSFDLVE